MDQENDKYYAEMMKRSYEIAKAGLSLAGQPNSGGSLDYWARAIYPMIARPEIFIKQDQKRQPKV